MYYFIVLPPYHAERWPTRFFCISPIILNIFSFVLSLSFLQCWDQCATTQPEMDNSIRETWPLRTMELIRHGSLVSAEVAWSSTAAAAGANGPSKCLVTWEVSGGGLMGNLLTESDNVQLSLWPDSKYKVQVACKNKVSGGFRGQEGESGGCCLASIIFFMERIPWNCLLGLMGSSGHGKGFGDLVEHS